MATTHKINKEFFYKILDILALNQGELAKKMRISPQTFSRWINTGYPARKIRELARTLDLKNQEFRKLINLSSTSLYLPSVKPQLGKRSIELSTFWFTQQESTKSLHIPDLSHETSSKVVADILRGYLKIVPSEDANSFHNFKKSLARYGIQSVPLSFEFFELANETHHRSIIVRGSSNLFVIFIDADTSPSLSIDFLASVARIFRSGVKSHDDELLFCEKVASEIIHPRDKIEMYWNANASSFENFNKLHRKFGNSIHETAYILFLYKFIDTQSLSLKKFNHFQNYNTRDAWNFYEDLATQNFALSVLNDLKMAYLDGSISELDLSQYLNINTKSSSINNSLNEISSFFIKYREHLKNTEKNKTSLKSICNIFFCIDDNPSLKTSNYGGKQA